jgi:hypothetical protein
VRRKIGERNTDDGVVGEGATGRRRFIVHTSISDGSLNASKGNYTWKGGTRKRERV